MQNLLDVPKKTFKYLFDSIIKEVSSTNIILEYLLLNTIGKRLDKKKILFNYLDRILIQNLGNT